MTIYLLPDVAEKLKAIAKARKTMVGRVIEELTEGAERPKELYRDRE